MSQLKFSAYKKAKHQGISGEELNSLYEEYLHELLQQSKDTNYRYFHTNGFDHEPLTVISNSDEIIEEMNWGLIPHWTRNEGEANSIQNKTINARAETLFEKPAFKSAKSNRCLLVVPSFFEYHLKGNKKIPHRIKMKDDSPMIIAGIWDEYKEMNKRTFSIVTTKANELLTEIHNNGKEPRMPLILDAKNACEWLKTSSNDQERLTSLVKSYPADKMEAYPVRSLVGKSGTGNTPQAIERFDENDWLLF